jgi:hypothetical protein
MTKRIPLAAAVMALVAGAACSGDDGGDHRAVAASRAVGVEQPATSTGADRTTGRADVTLTLHGSSFDGVTRSRARNGRVEIVLDGVATSWCA